MNSDTEKFRSKQEQGTRNSTGSVDTSDSKGNSLPTKESQNNPPHDISKKNPPQGTDSQHQGQQKTEGLRGQSDLVRAHQAVRRMMSLSGKLCLA